MTFLTAAQSAAIRLVGRKPTSFFSSTNTFEMEIVDLASDVVDDVVKYRDWRSLTIQKTMAGDGVTVGFDLPADYDRMPKDEDVRRANWYTWGYVDAPNLNFWKDLVNGLATPSPGYWIMLDKQMQFMPPIGVNTVAEFYYISSAAINPGSSPKSKFTADDDEFLFGDRLLTLGLIWKWRSQKGLEYGQAQEDYEVLIAQLSGADKGSKIIKAGQRQYTADTRYAYPGALGP